MFPKRLLLQPDPVVVTGIPIPVNVESSVSAPPKLGNGTTGFHRASKGPLVPNALPVPFPSTITIPIPSNARVFNYLPGQSNSPDPSIPPTKKDRDVLTKLPKSLLYYGQSKWFVFQSKFERYARVQDWSDAECADCLGALWRQGANRHRARPFLRCPSYITATDRRCRASGYCVTIENRRKCAAGYGGAAHPNTELPRTKDGRMNFEGLLGVFSPLGAEESRQECEGIPVSASLSLLPWVRPYGGGQRGEKWEEYGAQKERSDESHTLLWGRRYDSFAVKSGRSVVPVPGQRNAHIPRDWEPVTHRYSASWAARLCTVSCARVVDVSIARSYKGITKPVTVNVFVWWCIPRSIVPFRDVYPTSRRVKPTSSLEDDEDVWCHPDENSSRCPCETFYYCWRSKSGKAPQFTAASTPSCAYSLTRASNNRMYTAPDIPGSKASMTGNMCHHIQFSPHTGSVIRVCGEYNKSQKGSLTRRRLCPFSLKVDIVSVFRE
ncbi:hypothetical protein DPMN_132927 [Dreissena polymorpha]|uniref:Uncharacterized protein n=1 Tax=Dreissena polymorpha TaxID=45954 RepID=A0A9D4FTD2_DREPO|nr:hypothetical protein DPMN_132927 [Dreissena polymorpha]